MIAKSAAASIFRDTRGSRSIEISVPGAFTAVGFSGQQKNPGASAAERGRPSLFKTIDEDQRERHDHINRSGRSTYPGRISVLTSGATPNFTAFLDSHVDLLSIGPHYRRIRDRPPGAPRWDILFLAEPLPEEADIYARELAHHDEQKA